MTKLFSALAVVFLMAGAAFAQTPVTTPPSTPVSVTCGQLAVGTSVIKFSDGSTGTLIEAAKPVTDCTKKAVYSIGYAQILVPPKNTSFYLVGPRVDSSLGKLFPKISAELANVGIFAGAGLGTATVNPNNAPLTNHFAYGMHGGLNISPGSFLSMQTVFSIEAGLVGYNRTVFRATTLPQNAGQFSAGIQFIIGAAKQ